MPKIIPKKGGGTVIWDKEDFLRGLSFDWGSGNVSSLPGAVYSQAINVFKRGYYGILQPGYKTTNLTDLGANVTSLIKDIVAVSSNTEVNAYAVSGSKLLNIDLISEIVLNGTVHKGVTWPYSITAHGGHSAEADGQGIQLYPCNVSSALTTLLFFAWEDNTDADVGIYNFTGAPDDDWLSTVPAGAAALTKGVPHPMIVGKDRCLYIANGNKLMKLDGLTGANGTLTTALTLSQDMMITSLERQGNYLLVGFYDKTKSNSTNWTLGECFVGWWNYAASNFDEVKLIKENYLSALYNWNGRLLAFLNGRSSSSTTESYMYELQGSEFKKVGRFANGAPNAHSIEAIDDILIIGDNNSGATSAIYSYDGSYLHSNFTTNRQCGFVKNLMAGKIYTSGYSGSAYVISKHNTGYDNSNASYITESVDIPHRSTITQLRIYSKKLISGNTVGFIISTNNFDTDAAEIVYSYAVEGAVSYKTFDSNNAGGKLPILDVHNVAVKVGSFGTNAASPSIIKIEADFEITDLI